MAIPNFTTAMMKLLPNSIFILVAFLSVSSVVAQDVSGIWRGYFITEYGDQYKYEVQIGQSKKNSLTGVTYSYLDTRFYGKAAFSGHFTVNTDVALVQETRTVEVKMSSGSVACIMKCRLVYSKSGREEFLEGSYTSTYEKSEPESGIKRGGNCGGGKVFLRKVPTSDFYVEPFLRNEPKKNPNKTDIAKKKATPLPKKSVTTKKPQPKNQTTVKKPVQKPVVKDEVKPAEEVVVKPRKAEPKKIDIPQTTRERVNELTKTIDIHSNQVEIQLYDNGEIDNDTVSIYHNGKLILANKRLSAKPITYTLTFDEESPEHVLTMVAENMGTIPPNTSLMIIMDGDRRHQVSITSTEQKNAVVRFRYQGNN